MPAAKGKVHARQGLGNVSAELKAAESQKDQHKQSSNQQFPNNKNSKVPHTSFNTLYYITFKLKLKCHHLKIHN